jgi:hypothetical protein
MIHYYFIADGFCRYDVPRDFDVMFTISSKCILKPFRSMKFLTKSCNFCEILFGNNEEDTITVVVGCKSGAEIRYIINKVATGELLEVDSDPKDYKSIIRTEAKLIIGSLTNFAHNKGLANLTLKVEDNKMLLKSCATDLVKKGN